MPYKKAEPNDWFPGLLHGERILQDVLDTLPGIKANQISPLIRFFENPSSVWAFPGAISLHRHDCLHILLGRGIKEHDEPFVLGFTMGQSDGVNNYMTRLIRFFVNIRHPFAKNKNEIIRNWQIDLYKFIAKYVYVGGYRLNNSDLVLFDIGLGFGERSKARNIENFDFENNAHMSLKELRDLLGINILKLEALNRTLQIYVPGYESSRLDTSDDVDHSHITDEE